jgi:hypothetical protein
MKTLRDALRATIQAASEAGSNIDVRSDHNVVVSVNQGATHSTQTASAHQSVDIRQGGHQQPAAERPEVSTAGEGGRAEL